MIKRIELDGYRLLDGFSADFSPLTVVIGANAVGKSTLLDGLQLIAQCAEFPLNTAINLHGGLTSLRNVAASDKKFGWKITFSKANSFGKNLYYEVALQEDMKRQVEAQYEILRSVEPIQDYGEAVKFLEATPFHRNIFSREHHKLIPFDQVLPTQNKGQETTKPSVESIPLPVSAQEPALLLSQMRFVNEFPIPSLARVLLTNMAFYPGFDVGRFSTLRSKAAGIRPVTTLTPNGENLGTVLHEIFTRYDFRSAADDLRAFLRAAYPSFEEIHCETTYGAPPQVLVRVREKGMGRSMELWELSDGMLRFLCLASALLNPVPPTFVMVDEPESGLHPRLLPMVADMIKMAAERTQVAVTTHSPDLLNRFDLADIAVMSRTADHAPQTVWSRPTDRKSLAQMLQSVMGETLGDLHRSGELEAMA